MRRSRPRRPRSATRPPDESAAVRGMYRRTGLDPTKRRPSSEALLRRVRKGEALPRINSLVDVCNWCSLEFQLPYGLYDLDRIEGDVILRLGAEDEGYAGIRKDDVHVGGRIALADARGPFGNPSSDSARTMVTDAATTCADDRVRARRGAVGACRTSSCDLVRAHARVLRRRGDFAPGRIIDVVRTRDSSTRSSTQPARAGPETTARRGR